MSKQVTYTKQRIERMLESIGGGRAYRGTQRHYSGTGFHRTAGERGYSYNHNMKFSMNAASALNNVARGGPREGQPVEECMDGPWSSWQSMGEWLERRIVARGLV